MNKFVNKNKILTNDKNKLSHLFYEKFSGEKDIEVKSENYITYGYILLDAKNAVDLKIYYKDILLSCINGSIFKYLSVAFFDSGILKIEGECDYIKIEISGAEILENQFSSYLPINSAIALSGSNNIYSIDNVENLVNGNYQVIKAFNKLINVQTIRYQNSYNVACLIYDNGVYFCTNLDNYTNKIKVCDDCKSAIIVQNLQNDNIFIVYIFNNKLCYKILTNLTELSDEYYVYENNYDIPKNFSMIEITEFSNAVIGVHFDNGNYCVFIYNNSGWHKVLSKKCPITRIILNSSEIEIVEIFDYYLHICKYMFGNQISDPLVLIENSKDIYNVRDVLKVSEGYVICNFYSRRVIDDVF